MGPCFRIALYTLALISGVLALIIAAVALGTNYWLEFDVDRAKLTAIESRLSEVDENLGRFFFSRNRGLIRECYPDIDAPWIDDSTDVVDSDCFNLEFDDPDDFDVSDNFTTRNNLLIAAVAVFAFGILFVVVALILGIVATVRQTAKTAFAAFTFEFLTAFLLTTSIAIFLGAEHMERESSSDEGELIFRKNWSTTLDDATSTQFSWSFGLAWVAVGLALISCALYFVVGCYHYRQRRDDEDSVYDHSSSSSSSDRHSRDRKMPKSKKRNAEHPYAMNEAYVGVNPVYWNNPYHQGGMRPVLAVTDNSSEHARSSQYVYPQGGFFLGPEAVDYSGMSYGRYPTRDNSSRHSRHHRDGRH